MTTCPGCFTPLDGAGACSACDERGKRVGDVPYALRPPLVLNRRYRVGAVLGAGGFGITYMAQDTTNGQVVAIKEYMPLRFAWRVDTTIRPKTTKTKDAESDFKQGLDKFEKESDILRQHEFRNIVRVLDKFRENNTAYFVMEYLGDETFGDYVRDRGRLSYKQAYNGLAPVFDALHYIHTKLGIIHRDVSPENICILADRTVKLIDFGQAKASFQGSRGKKSHVVVRNGFSPSESYDDSYDGAEPFTDVYSVAATFYFAVTGVEPVASNTRANNAINKPSAPDLLEIPAGLLPPHAEDALRRALSIRRDDRPRSIREFQREIAPAGAPAPLPKFYEPTVGPSEPDYPPQPAPSPTPPAPPRPQPIPTPDPIPPTPVVKRVPGWGGWVAFCVAGLVSCPVGGYALLARDPFSGWAVICFSAVFAFWLVVLLRMEH